MFRRKKQPDLVATGSQQFRIVVEAASDGRRLHGRVYDEAGEERFGKSTYSTGEYGVSLLTEKCREWIAAEQNRLEVAAKGVLFEETVGVPRRESLEQNIKRLEAELLDLPA